LKKKLAPIVALGVVALATAAVAAGGKHVSSLKLTAALNAAQETPHPSGTKAGASGTFTATVTGTSIKWSLTFSHLTGAATAAHIHMGKQGTAGAVLVPLCGPCSSPASGSGKLTRAQLAQMKKGWTYVNVHTPKNAGGEIRGQIRVAM
jgi:hypothetical protein